MKEIEYVFYTYMYKQKLCRLCIIKITSKIKSTNHFKFGLVQRCDLYK